MCFEIFFCIKQLMSYFKNIKSALCMWGKVRLTCLSLTYSVTYSVSQPLNHHSLSHSLNRSVTLGCNLLCFYLKLKKCSLAQKILIKWKIYTVVFQTHILVFHSYKNKHEFYRVQLKCRLRLSVFLRRRWGHLSLLNSIPN